MDKTAVDTKEAAYFAFPFSMTRPQFQYEIQTGVVNPASDLYPGAGHEWFSVQHWVSVQQDGLSATVMPLDAPLVALGDIVRGAWPEQFCDRPGNVFSYVMDNYWDTNYRAEQGGHFRFRYVITSDSSTDPAELSRRAWEEATPLESNIVTTQDKAMNLPRALSGIESGFIDVDDRDLLLEAWKPAEDGKGTILRFLDLGGLTRQINVHIPILDLQGVWETDAVERDQRMLPLLGTDGFEFTIHPRQLITVRLVGRSTLPVP